MAAIIVRAKPGESADKLIKRFERAVKEFKEGIRKPKVFISKTEKRLEAEKEKARKIKKLEALREKGII